MLCTGIIISTVEIPKGIDSSVIRKINSVCLHRIGSETRILKNPTVEDEFKHEGVGAVPTMGTVMGSMAKAMVG